MVPILEEEPVQEHGKLLEEHHPGAIAEAEGAIAIIEKLKGRVHQEGEDVHRGQKIGEMALSVAEVVFETIAPDLEGLDVFVLDFPSGPSGLGESDEGVFSDRMIGDPGMVIEGLARLLVGDGELKPVRQESVVGVPEREIGHKAKRPAFPDDLGNPFALGLSLAFGDDDAVGSDLSGAGEVVDPLVGRWMGDRLAGKEKMESGCLRLLAEGLVGIEIVPQEGAVPVGIMGAPGVDPARSRPDLAVLLFPPVLPDNKLWRERHDPGLSGSHQRRGHRNVTVQDAPVRTVGNMAGGTEDPAVRGKGVGPVQGNEDRSVQNPIVRQASLGPQSVSDSLDQRSHLLRPDRIEDVPDLDVRRDIMHAEEGLDIVPSGRPRQISLKGQKRRRLCEEDGKGRAGGIKQGVLRVVPGFPGIRKSPESGGNPIDKSLSLAGNDIRGGVRNRKGFHAPRMPKNMRYVQ